MYTTENQKYFSTYTKVHSLTDIIKIYSFNYDIEVQCKMNFNSLALSWTQRLCICKLIKVRCMITIISFIYEKPEGKDKMEECIRKCMINIAN